MAETQTDSERKRTLEGSYVDDHDHDALLAAVDSAFHYRGDVTITQRSNGSVIEGFIFDIRSVDSSSDHEIRLMLKSDGSRKSVRVSAIAKIEFSGRDTASGKSFENWVKKYAQKKLAGEAANIESEPLHDD